MAIVMKKNPISTYGLYDMCEHAETDLGVHLGTEARATAVARARLRLDGTDLTYDEQLQIMRSTIQTLID